MAEKRKRGQNFTTEEKDKLVKIMYSHKEDILNKKTDGSTNEAKAKAWIDVTNTFNSSATVYRTKESLMKIWEKLKTESKMYYQTNRRSTTETGGGPSQIKTDPVLEQVCGLLGRACTGIIGVQDCDTEPPKKFFISGNVEQTDDIVIDYVVQEEVIKSADEEENEEYKNIQNISQKNCISKTPLWSRRRPHMIRTNERSESVSTLCSSFAKVNKKKEDIEDLKRQLLQEEIEFKRKLYELQLQAAAKDVEIKKEILNQIKGQDFSIQHLFGIPQTK